MIRPAYGSNLVLRILKVCAGGASLLFLGVANFRHLWIPVDNRRTAGAGWRRPTAAVLQGVRLVESQAYCALITVHRLRACDEPCRPPISARISKSRVAFVGLPFWRASKSMICASRCGPCRLGHGSWISFSRPDSNEQYFEISWLNSTASLIINSIFFRV